MKKVLLDDKNLHHKLRLLLTSHDVRTVDYIGLSGKKNGELLKECDNLGIGVLLTGDQNLSYQSNSTTRRESLIVVDTLDLNLLRDMASRILIAIDSATPGGFQLVQSRR